MKAIKTFNIGSAVKIFITLDNESPSSVVVTVKDPSSIAKVTEADATLEAGKTYSYIYQGSESDQTGTYSVTIKATVGSYESISKITFEMVD